jgi:hypothetical protein
MAKTIEAHDWSDMFRELMASKEKALDIDQYDLCLSEWQAAHEKKMIKNYILAAVLFVAGLWAVWEHAPFLAVLLLALSANFNRQSAHHILVSELMHSQRLLAMLINGQARKLPQVEVDR